MKKLFDIKRFRLYLWVGIVWLIFWLLHTAVSFPDVAGDRALNEIWRAIYIVAVNYLFFEYTLPRIKFTGRKFFISVLLLFAQVMLYTFGLYAWRSIGIDLHIFTSFITYPSISKGVGDQFSRSVSAIFIFGIAKHIYNYQKLKQAAQQLRIEKQAAELSYLKSQTNPHFLFNTLNNIYSLARDKSDLAPESILRLSKILRFMLYETGGAYIAIEQEIQVIRDYIALERLRYDDSLQVEFSYDIENMQQPIPPLLLIPFVENAFKHGVSETRSQPFVDIRLSATRQRLEFIVKNSVEDFSEQQELKENIGLSNLRRQLELLYKDFDLSVQQGGSVFTATLKINLTSHV